MPTRKDLKQLNAHVTPAVWAKLAAHAKMQDLSLWAFHSKLLADYAARTPLPSEQVLRAKPPRDLSEVIQVWVPLKLAMRLHSAARQMRDDTGEPLLPATLARMLLIHECQRETNLVQQMIEQVDPDYVDIVPFTGRTKWLPSEYTDGHLLVFKCTFETREAVFGAAQQLDTNVTHLTRRVLNEYLPAWIGDEPTARNKPRYLDDVGWGKRIAEADGLRLRKRSRSPREASE